jgi:hypothetical protein
MMNIEQKPFNSAAAHLDPRETVETELIHEYCADAAILPECAKDAQHEA